MKVAYKTRPDDLMGNKVGYVEGIDISLTPIEGLLFHSALLQFWHELSNNEKDRITAMKMCDTFEEKMAEMAGVK